ncbi:MAG: hypothetical protein AAF828_00655 [Bacteroidota bacterium]
MQPNHQRYHVAYALLPRRGVGGEASTEALRTKKVSYLLWSLILLLVLTLPSCGSDTSSQVADEDSIEANADSAASDELALATGPLVAEAEAPATVEPKDEYVEPLPEEAPPAMEEVKSEFKQDQCCADIAKPQACCCEKVINKLKEYLSADDLDSAGNLSGTDEYYQPCVSTFANFEAQFNKVIDDYFGDSE